MPPTVPLRPLPTDFLERLAVLQREADEAGQTDVGYALELAGQMAERRRNEWEMEARGRRVAGSADQ